MTSHLKKLFSIILLIFALSSCSSALACEKCKEHVSDSATLHQTEPTTDKSAALTADSSESITILMAGDLLLHRFVQMSGEKPGGGYDFTHIFAKLRDQISSADISIINQETPLAGEEFGLSGYPLFNAPLEVADAIAWAGFDVVLQATNHTLDKGKSGVIACRSYFAEHYPEIKIAGTALTEDESAGICVVERKGFRVALLNYTYGTNGNPIPSDMPWIVSLLDEQTVREDIKKAKEIADFVVVCPHWGIEYVHSPSSGQRLWCKLFFECGADLVIGTHPHVIQPLEWYEEDGRTMPVFWSLGNFVNSTAETGRGVCNRMLGGMALIRLSRGEDREVYVSEASVIPIVTQLNEGYAGITVYSFYDYSEELAAANALVQKRDPLFSYSYCQKVFSEIFGDAVN